MPNAKELDRELTERLYLLLKLQKQNVGRGVVGLDEAITGAKVPMTAEQIAWVEKLVSELA